ncbi:hypothetical protein [Sediminicola luteus]|uniref:Uncharacterized protein n=1 Tax=Sediminicola luteus TaxID=319238 RepID=A0ABV2TYD6_9FLAO
MTQKIEWQEIKEIWKNSSQTKKIDIHISQLQEELKSKASEFEKNSIKSDISFLTPYWEDFKSKTSQFEKDSVKNDLLKLTKTLKNFLPIFKRKK